MDTVPSRPSSAPLEPPVTAPEDVLELVNRISRSLNTAVLYGTTHPVTVKLLEGCYELMTAFVDHYHGAHFSIEEERLIVNGVAASEGPLTKALTDRLAGLNLFSFSIEPGFSAHEFVKFMDLLCPHGSGSGVENGAEWIQAAGLDHLQTRTFAYRRIPADELAAEASGVAAPPMSADLANLVAFLASELGPESQTSPAPVRSMPADPDQLADALLQAVEVQSASAQASGEEPLKDVVIGCISKLISQMASGEAVRTEKDRKQARKSLSLLAKSLLDRLKEQSGEQAAQAAGQLIEDARESLDVETTVSKYARYRKAAEDSERRLRGMIERAADDAQQLDELRQRLMECGVTPDEWQKLTFVCREQNPEPCEGAADDIRAIGQLTAQIEDTVARSRADTPNQPSTELKQLVTDTNRRLASLAKTSEHKIESLRKALKGDSKKPPLTGKALLETIAEIVQEIIQPLTTATTAIAILARDSAPENTDTRQEVLSLATESCRRMSHLVNCLFRIAGTPAELYPHKALLNVLYEEPAENQ
jgi:hypothetical protein